MIPQSHVNPSSKDQPSVTTTTGSCVSDLIDLYPPIHSTLVDSTPGVYKAWKTFSLHYSLGDYQEITHATHGRRLYDTLKELCKIQDETKLLVTETQMIIHNSCVDIIARQKLIGSRTR
jgi:hypothetical protein